MNATVLKIWGSVLLLLLAAGIFLLPVTGDAPFYVSMARDIAHGLVPYRDIRLNYTPLVMYFNSIGWLLWERPPFAFFVFLQYAVIVASGFALYGIARKKELSPDRALLLSLFFLITTLSSDGSAINLEVYGILLTLLAFRQWMGARYFWTGLLLGLSFFCKQYGILNFVPFALLVFFEAGRLRNLTVFALGGLCALALFAIYFIGIAHVEPMALIEQLTGQGYGQMGIAQQKSVLTFASGGKIFWLMFLPLVLVRPNLKDKIQLSLAVGIVLALLPTVVQQFPHYFLNAFPYLALLIVCASAHRPLPSWTLHAPMFVAAILLGLRLYRHSNVVSEQAEMAKTVAEYYPPGSPVFLKGLTNFLYVRNDYRNPAPKEAGYVYAFKTDDRFLESHTVLTFDRIESATPVRILKINGQTLYEY